MKLAIVGSRNFKNYTQLCKVMEKIPMPELIVSGGASGADSLAERWSLEYLKKEAVVFKANWYPEGKPGPFDKGAGFKRNIEIVDFSDAVLAFWDTMSKGTIHSINIAISKCKPISIVHTGWPNKLETKDILGFQNEHRWLSNMWPTKIVFGLKEFTYPWPTKANFNEKPIFRCAESAYQASKFADHEEIWKNSITFLFNFLDRRMW